MQGISRQANRIVALAAVVAVVTIATAAISARASRDAAGSAGEVAAPGRLSETGLYLPGTLQVDPRNRPYAPQYPLWTDGAAKARWVQLPEGATIDATDIAAWELPVGTKFWKEFSFRGRKVETRLLWRASEAGWVFATYAWNDEQTDAVLASPETGVPAAFEVAPGASHDIPSVPDCRACHDSGRTEILGFSALQLSDDRDPNAPHAEPLEPGMVTLAALVREGVLSPSRTDLVRNPPRIPGDRVARAALGYLSANCGHCHNAGSSIASVGLFLKQPPFAGAVGEEPAATAVGQSSQWQIPGAAEGASLRIAPGSPALSTLLHRMRSRRPASQMPPLGTVMADQEGIELIERWIRQMNPR